MRVDGGTVLGWCDIVLCLFEGMKHVGRLGMGVRHDSQARGIDRKLLAAAVQTAFKAGIERIELEVFASNQAAVRLYDRS